MNTKMKSNMEDKLFNFTLPPKSGLDNTLSEQKMQY
jgi:hypothetical protein